MRSLGQALNFDAQSFAAAIGVFRPGASSTVLWPPELAYEVRINALGLRGPEIARTPPPGRTRILALGDSMTFGFYLEENETWPARLEALLRERRARRRGRERGLGGWSISSETLFLEERALALAPAHVIVAFCANDIADLDQSAFAYEAQKQAARWGAAGAERGSSRARSTSSTCAHRWRGSTGARPFGELDHPQTSVDLPAGAAERSGASMRAGSTASSARSRRAASG